MTGYGKFHNLFVFAPNVLVLKAKDDQIILLIETMSLNRVFTASLRYFSILFIFKLLSVLY